MGWDFSIQTDHVPKAKLGDQIWLYLFDKKERSCKIIDFAVPGDSRIEEKEKDKIEKYQDMGREFTEDMECESEDHTISCRLFIGAIPKQFGTAQNQKTVLLAAGILRKVLEI